MKPSVPLQFLLLLVAGWVNRGQQQVIEYLQAENRVLRNRLGSKRLRWTDAERRVLAEKGHLLGRKLLAKLSCIARPETILRWYRELVAAKYDGSHARPQGPGRPPTRAEAAAQLLIMARENTSWGYTRLCGAMKNIGFTLGRSTVARILADNGMEPAPKRGRTMSWSTFIKAHIDAIAAADFFSVEVLTRGGLIRYLVLFVIEPKTRRVNIAGISCQADGPWMAQVGRSLTDAVDGFLREVRYLIVDRDPLYTEHFRSILKSTGVELLRLPARSPNLNAYAERFVRSIKSECLSRIVPLGERHLRQVVREYVEHYHHERNHQGLENVIPLPIADPDRNGHVRRRVRLGGILNFYHRDAA